LGDASSSGGRSVALRAEPLRVSGKADCRYRKRKERTMNAQSKVTAGGVHRKLSQARQKFHTLALRKSGKNSFAGYDYFELGDFLVPALKVFDEVGLGATISFTSDTATMTIVDLDTPDQTIVITSPMGSAALKGCHEVQNIGAVETYQRRYLWVAALEIVEHDALDKTTGKQGSEPEATGLIDDGQWATITQMIEATGTDTKAFCAYLKVPSIKALPAAKYDAAFAALKAKAEKQKEPA
jgi:hypothetical protein